MQPNALAQKKKRLLILTGILALPVVVIIAAVISLAHPHKKTAPPPPDGSAFNAKLPGANVPKKEQTKLELYMKAQDDSLKQHAARAKDPYSALSLLDTSRRAHSPLLGYATDKRENNPYAGGTASDNTDQQVTERMAKLYGLINHSNATVPDREKYASALSTPPSPDVSPQVLRLQKMLQDYQKPDTTPNPQLVQVKQILDQIKEIQHPSTNAAASASEQPMPVTAQLDVPHDSGIVSSPVVAPTGFFGLSDDNDSTSVQHLPVMEAVVNADQVVQTGSIVKLRLLQPIYIAGVHIPANSFIYGPATISGERVTILLTNVLSAGHVYPIAMSVYDGADGLNGLYVPGMITRDVVKQNMSQSVSGLSIGSLDPSLGAQAATAAIETARNLMSRKIAIVKAMLKAGHLAVLRPTAASR